jgi:hypothetical protein
VFEKQAIMRLNLTILLTALAISAAFGCGGGTPTTSPPEPQPAAVSETGPTGDDECAADLPRAKVARVTLDVEGGPDLEVRWRDEKRTDQAHTVWKGDLNGDGRDDLITRVAEACGNWGECVFQAFVDCGAGETMAYVLPEYRTPLYAVGLEVAESETVVDDAAWKDLIETERQGPALDDPDASEPEPRQYRLAFDGLAFQRTIPPDRITHADNEEDCRRCNGTWGPRGIIGALGCVCPTIDGGKPCRRPSDCEHRCELPWSDAVAAGKIDCRPDGHCDGGGEPLEGRCAPSFEIFGCRAWIVEDQTDDGPRLRVRHVCVD